MGKHSRPEWRPETAEPVADITAVLPNSQLLSYRAAVEDLVMEAGKHVEPSALLAGKGGKGYERFVGERLSQPEFTPVLSRLDGGMDAVAARLIDEIRGYQPQVRSPASDVLTFARIFLLAQIDAAWWSWMAPFVSDTDVLRSTELVDLTPLRSAKVLRFQYRAQSSGLPGRTRDWAQRQVRPAIRPRTAGLRFTRSRPVVVAMINQIAHELAAVLPPGTPRLWVTSMVRSVQHQHRLRTLGYAAVLPSSHCVGYACDVEMQWFRQFDPNNLLARLLLERQEAGQLNVIDEGQVWHLCVSPPAYDELQAAYDAQLSDH